MRFSRLPVPASLPAVTTSLYVLGLFAVAAPRAAHAQVALFSNLDTAQVSSSGTSISANGTGYQKSVAFTTGGTAFSLSSVQANLSLGADVTAGNTSNLRFTLHTPIATDDPDTLLVNLGTQAVTNVYSAPTVYTFTPATPFILNANTRYVLLLACVSGSDGDWHGNRQVAPTARNGSGYSTPVYRLSFGPGAGYTPSSVFNLFQINGTAVVAAAPEPGSLPLIGMGLSAGLGASGAIRRRKAKRTTK